MSLKGKTVLFFAGPLYEDLELWYPKIRLEEEGAATTVAGIGEKTYAGKRGYPVTVDTNVADVDAADFDGLVIPGGFAPDQLRRHEAVLKITREMFRAGKPVAFICHAGWVAISAKILKGKRATSVRAIRDDMENAGVTWEDAPVVVDGNLISSRTPADLPQFCKALIAARRSTRSMHGATRPTSNHVLHCSISFAASRATPNTMRCVGRMASPGSWLETMNDSTRSARGSSAAKATAVS